MTQAQKEQAAYQNIIDTCNSFSTERSEGCSRAASAEVQCSESWAQGCGSAIEPPDGNDDTVTMADLCAAFCTAGSMDNQIMMEPTVPANMLAFKSASHTEVFMAVGATSKGQHNLALIGGSMCFIGMVLVATISHQKRHPYSPILG
jgi:hypothetical protein